MTLTEAIEARHSVRRYKAGPLSAEAVTALRAMVDEVNAEAGLHVQLVLDEPKAFASKWATYGQFEGVSNYLVMAAGRGAEIEEKVGYYGEKLVLLAQTLGLCSCWVGLTYSKVEGAFEVAAGEKVHCVISLGYGLDNGRVLKRKTVEQVSNAGPDTPEWFVRGVRAAIAAPTAVNQQKFHFEFVPAGPSGKAGVIASKARSLVGYTNVDLGIAKLHFEIGAGAENFEWA